MWQAFLDLGTDLAQNNRFLYGVMVVATMALLGLILGLVWEGIFSLLKLRPRKDSPREGPGKGPAP
ncbi:MAG: hypothetical protein ACE5IA_02455 [Dehalococcoidia bacterium]